MEYRKRTKLFSKGCYTVEDIISVIYTDHSAQYSNQVYSEANPNQVHLAAIPIAPIAYVVLGFLLNHYADQFYDDICAWVKYHMNDVNTYVITQQALNGLLPPLFLPISFDIYVDPAGYIYDVDTGQRISGAYVWLQRPDGSGDWQNVSTGENPPVSQPDTNPLISDKDGMYQWDTLPGSYRVHVESPGYEPADSIVVSVPPPVFDLHVGLHHIYDPDVPPIIPVANFSNDISSGYAPLKVYFTDLSENATGISWDFGDGNNSTDRYPIHTYSAPGNYTVNLTASNGNGVNSKTGTIDAQALPIYPVADFITNVSEGYAPLTVQFNDSSVNVDSWNWDFNNDGNVDSTEQNPIYAFKSVGNYTVNLTVINGNGTASQLATINVVTSLVIPPQSVSEIQSSPESTWINWTWTNPDDPNFDHTEIYLNNTFQANTSAEYFNTTDLQPETDYTIGMRTADIYGNVNETWVNASTKTKSLPDIDQTITDVDLPVIESVMVFPANTTAGSKIDVSANITDNIGVSEVTAGNVQLMNIDGSWQGNITAPSSFGKYSLSIKASDAAGNTVNTSVPYNVVRRQGKVNIEILPTASKIVTGKNATLAIKIKNTQNIDDTFKVRVNVNGLPASYRAGIPWFNWTEKTVNLRAKQEVLIPIELKVPAGTVTGVKVFRANVNSEKFSVRGSDNGYLVISRPSKDINKQIGPRGLWFSR